MPSSYFRFRVAAACALLLSAAAPSMALDRATASAPPKIGGPSTKPGYDCSKASGEVETLICKDRQLAQVDAQLNLVYRQTLKQSKDKPELITDQRGWIKGRNECWKAGASGADLRRCVVDAYAGRLIQLQLHSGRIAKPKPLHYRCGKQRSLLLVAFYAGDPKAVELEFEHNKILAFSHAGDGNRYLAHSVASGSLQVAFVPSGAGASLDYFGERLVCGRSKG